MAQTVAEYLRSRGINNDQGGEGPTTGDTLDRILQRRGSTRLAGVARSIYGQESSYGAADTSQPNSSDVRGPMQVKDTTFAQMQREGRIPANYRWDNPEHNTEAGVAYIEMLAEKTGGDPRKIAQGYYGGPGAIGKESRRDPRNPSAPTVGQYGDEVVSRMGVTGPARATAPSGAMSPWQYLEQQRNASRAAPSVDLEKAVVEERAQQTAEPGGPAMTWDQVVQHEAWLKADSDTREQIRERYWQDEVAPRIPADQQAAARKLFDQDTNPSLARRIGDAGRAIAGGAIQGVGMTVRGAGEMMREGAQPIAAGIAALGGPEITPINPLDGAANAIEGYSQGVLDSRSLASQMAQQQSTPEGDVSDPATWSMGQDPSLGGYIQHGAVILGQFAPIIASVALTKNLPVAGQVAVAGGLGGAQGGGAAAQQARETIEGMDEAELAKESSYYRQLRERLGHEQAKAMTAAEAAKWAFRITLPVSAAGGAATGAILSPAVRLGAGLVGGSYVGNMALRGTASAIEEGLQETGEGIATEQGINVGAGTERDVMAGSFPNAVLGAIGGATPGAGSGALAAHAERARQAAANLRGQPTVSPAPTNPQTGPATPPPAGGPTPPPAGGGPRPAGPTSPEGPIPAEEVLGPVLDGGPAAPEPAPATAPPLAPSPVAATNGPAQEAAPLLEDAEQGGSRYNKGHEQANRPNAEVPGRVPNVSVDDPSVPGSKSADIRGVRGQRDQGLPAVDGELRPLPDRYGTASGAADVAGQNRPERPLRAGELPVGDRAAASGEPEVLPDRGVSWSADDRTGGGETGGSAADDIPTTGVTAGTRPGASGDAGPTPLSSGLEIPDAQRGNDGRAGVGSPPGNQSADASGADSQGGAPRASITTGIDAAAHEAATSPLNDRPEPTQAQKEAGNYKVGRVRVQGLDISIENPKGSERKGVSKDGKPWSTVMPGHYGYIKGTVGKDKDHIDVTLGDAPDDTSRPIFVFNQADAGSGKFDEHKTFMGYADIDAARKAYRESFSGKLGRKMENNLLGIAKFTPEQFKEWLASGDHKKPAQTPTTAKPTQAIAETETANAAEEVTPPARSLYVEWNGRRHAVASVEDAQAKWAEFRDRSAAGASEIGSNLEVKDSTGAIVAHITYNGRAWTPEEWAARNKPKDEAPKAKDPLGATGPEAAGWSAFQEGKPRVPPDWTKGPAAKKWLQGWDRANIAAPVPDETSAEAPTPSPNTIFTEDAAEKARAILRAKLGQANAGLDPELVQAGITLAGYHVEKGARTFAAYAKAMVGDLGDIVKPYLKSWYAALAFDPRAEAFASEMTPVGELAALNVDALLSEAPAVDAEPSPAQNGDADANATETEQLPAGDPRATPVDDAARDGDREQVDAGLAEVGRVPDRGRGVPGDTAGAGEAGTGRVQPAGERSPRAPRDSGTVRPESGPTDAGLTDHSLADTDLGKGSLTQKYRDNIAAIRILRAMEAEQRIATPEERAAIAKYVGWGALKGVFDPNNKTWAKQHAELKGLLTEAEWKAARASILNAHYTSKTVVEAMFSALDALGFKRGRVLEPSVGVGNFFGLMPPSMRTNSQLHGVELDSLTAKIAAALYPSAKVKQSGFEAFDIPSGYFDLAIGNPPFGSEAIVDDARSPYSGFSIHNYFFAKSIDKLRPGGLLTMVVSHSFMDAKNETARQWIADRADLVSAVRLPNTAFKENAGTEVVTDILVFQRRDGAAPRKPSWVTPVEQSVTDPKTGETAKAWVNPYFVENPTNVLGTPSAGGTMYRAGEYTVEPVEGWQGKLKEWAKALPAVYTPINRTEEMSAANYEVPDGLKVGSFFVDGQGNVRQRGTGHLGERTAEVWNPPNARAAERMKGMIELRDLLRSQIRLERSADATETQIEENRKRLNGRYDAFLKKNGHLNSPTNRRVFIHDTEAPLLLALEFDFDRGISKAIAERDGIDARDPSAKKADILQRRVLFPPSDNIKVASAQDALLASLNYKGAVDLEYMARVFPEKSAEEIEAELGDTIFRDPQAGLVTADEYLSGDVKTKLTEAEAAAKGDPAYQRNAEALTKVIPRDKGPSEISVQLGANFLPPAIYEAFGKHVSGRDFTIRYGAGQWFIDQTGYADPSLNEGKYGIREMTAVEIFDHSMSGRGVVVKETVRHSDGSTTTFVKERETELAREKQSAMKAEWKAWLWGDPERAAEVARLYNEKLNRIVPRKFDGSHMTFPGMSPAVTLLAHQKNGVWRGLQARQVLYDHVVGAGKTFQMATLAMEARRLGIARKPLFVVPNHLTLQWRQEFYKLYPSAYILVAEPDDFSKGNRERFFSKIATGDWDAVVVGHSSLKKIPLPDATEQAIFEEQIEEISNAIEQLKTERGDRHILRDMERIKKNLQAKMQERANARGTRDNVLSFDELGIDGVFIDEMHEFKNLFYNSRMDRTAGMGNPAGSAKAFDLFVKLRWLTDTLGPKALLVTATGTPVSNSLVEMYTMQRYMQYQTLKGLDLHVFDAWAAQFGEVEHVYEVKPSGVGYRQSNRFSKFANLPALMALYNSFADTITLEDLKGQEEAQGRRFPVPKIATGRPVNVVAQRSPRVADFMGVPQVQRNENGDLAFKWQPGEWDITKDEATGKFKAKIRDEGAQHWYEAGTYETEADAKAALVARALAPVITVRPESILGQFENLKQLTAQTKGRINALSLTGLANKAGLDYRLIDPSAPDFAGSKINLAVERIVAAHKKWRADKGAQLVFCDLSVPLSARTALAAKEKFAYVRGSDGTIERVRATLHTVEGVEQLPYFMVARGKGSDRTVAVYDADTGLRVQDGFRDRGAARTFVEDMLGDAEKRQRWLDARMGRPELTQDEIDEFNDANDIDTEEVPYITLEDIAGTAGASAFSVYDDIKAKLVAAGIPEREVAFIHDYDTPAAKAKLFAAVNAGRVRALLGSTPKMGAGTNVQKRLVALHHIDAPWRPSDLEQREGRIVRRGNDLYERDPDGFEVEIYRYATDQTYDTRRWQILEHKARGIEQLRKYDGTTNEIDDIEGEAANAADMKAAASGDPMILEETRLKTEIKRLENVQAAHADTQMSLVRKAASMENEATGWLPKVINGLEQLVAKTEPKPEKGFAGMTVEGTKYAAKDDAGKALGERVATAVASIDPAAPRKAIRVSLKYRGHSFSVDVFKPAFEGGQPSIELNGPDGPVSLYSWSDVFSATGAIQRLDNYLDRLPSEIDYNREKIKKNLADAVKLREEAKTPFGQADALAEVRSQYRRVQQALMAKGPSVPAEQIASLKAATEAQKKAIRKAGLGKTLAEIMPGEPDEGAASEAPKPRRRLDQRALREGREQPEMPTLSVRGDSVFSRRAAPAEQTGASVAQVYRWLKQQPLFDRVHVVKDVAGLRRVVGDPNIFPDTEGYYRLGDDKVYLVASMIPDLATAETLYRHEVEGHLAVELYGDIQAAVGDVLAAKNSAAIAPLWAEVAKTQPNLPPKMHAREVIALVAERGTKFPAVDRLVGRVRALLRKLGITLKFSEADIRGIVANAARAAAKGGPRGPRGGQQAVASRMGANLYYGEAANSAWDGLGYFLSEALSRMSGTRKPPTWADWQRTVREALRDAPAGSAEHAALSKLLESLSDEVVLRNLRNYHRAWNRESVGGVDSAGKAIAKAIGARWEALADGNEDYDPPVVFRRGGQRAPASLDHTGLIDAAFKHLGGKQFGRLITSPLYDRLIRAGSAVIPEKVKQGLVADYGLPEPYLDAKIDKQAAVNRVLRKTKNLVEMLAGLDREQSRVAYLWMNEKPDTDLEAHLLSQLPADSREVMQRMKEMVDELGRQAVEVGLLTQDSYDRNAMAYLHRSYKVHMTTKGESVKARHKKNASIRADNYKGRGIRDNVDPASLGEFQLGDKRLRIELRGPRGGLREVRYIELDAPVPDGWTADGEWEVRWQDQRPGQGEVVGMWRDLTPDERQRLGEVEEVRYAFAKTMLNAIHDIENQKFLAWVGDEYGVDPAGIDPENLVEASDGFLTLKTYRPDQYVKVPKSGIPKTPGLKKYGKLAGQVIPAVMWNDIRNTMALPESDFARFHDSVMRAWKISKALALDTPIPTPAGWTTMGDLKPGDTVFDERGQPAEVLQATETQHNHECYRVEFSDGTSIVADRGHLWMTHYRGAPGIRETHEILATLKEPTRGDNNHSIPVAGAMVLPDADLPIHPYVLGLWLGDGHSSGARVTTGADDADEVMGYVKEAGYEIGAIRRDPRSAAIDFGLRALGVNGKLDGKRRHESVQAKLRVLGLINNKRIPAVYLRASEAQRRALLMGLMDSDGHITDKGICGFCTTDDAIKDGILELLRSLGYKPTVTQHETRCNGKPATPAWKVHFKAYADRPVFKLARKVARLRLPPETRQRSQTRQIVAVTPVPSVPVRCILVSSPSHLFLAGAGMVPTHNTALSPTVHMNNVMSNFVLADIAEVRARDIARALRTIVNARQGDEAAKDLIARYEDSGAEQGSFHAMEIQQDIIKPLLAELENTEDESLLGQLSAVQIVSLLKAGDIKNAAKAIAQKPGLKQTLGAGKKMIDLYRSEDSVFRLAKFMRESEAGKSDRDAGKAARDAFLNYEINAPVIQTLRRTALPFVAFSYRAIPRMIETAARKPWKLAKYFTAGAALNAMAYAMMGLGTDDEDRERALLPEELQGRVLGVFPRLVRLPWHDSNGAPTFLDVRRWVPAGDMMDTMGSHSVLPLPNWLSLGGPLAFALEAYTNKSMFTGEPIFKESDTPGQRAAKFADYAFKWASPNLPLPNPANFVLPAGRDGDEPRVIDLGLIPGIDLDQLQTYAWTGVMRAGTGREDAFGRESGSVAQALASSVGIKVRSYPIDVAKKRVIGELNFMNTEIDRNIRQLSRERARGGLTEAEYRRRLEVEVGKKQDLYRKAAERLGAGAQP